MKSQKVGSVSGIGDGDDFFTKAGQMLGLYVVVSGTNEVGQIGTASDVGRFIITREGNQIQNAGFDDYQKIMNTRSGISVLESADGGAFEASCFIPFFEESFQNCLNITGDEELNVEFQPDPANDAVFADLNVEIVTREADYPESYEYKILSKNKGYVQATKADPVGLGQVNITNLFIEDKSDILDLFQLSNSRGLVQSSVSKKVLRAITLQENQVEDSTFDLPKIRCFTPGKRDTIWNSGSQATCTVSGAGNVRFIMCSIDR